MSILLKCHRVTCTHQAFRYCYSLSPSFFLNSSVPDSQRPPGCPLWILSLTGWNCKRVFPAPPTPATAITSLSPSEAVSVGCAAPVGLDKVQQLVFKASLCGSGLPSQCELPTQARGVQPAPHSVSVLSPLPSKSYSLLRSSLRLTLSPDLPFLRPERWKGPAWTWFRGTHGMGSNCLLTWAIWSVRKYLLLKNADTRAGSVTAKTLVTVSSSSVIKLQVVSAPLAPVTVSLTRFSEPDAPVSPAPLSCSGRF